MTNTQREQVKALILEFAAKHRSEDAFSFIESEEHKDLTLTVGLLYLMYADGWDSLRAMRLLHEMGISTAEIGKALWLINEKLNERQIGWN